MKRAARRSQGAGTWQAGKGKEGSIRPRPAARSLELTTRADRIVQEQARPLRLNEQRRTSAATIDPAYLKNLHSVSRQNEGKSGPTGMRTNGPAEEPPG